MTHRQVHAAASVAARFAITLSLGGMVLASMASPGAAAFKFTKVVDTNTPVPGAGGATFGLLLGFVPAVSGGNVAFLANAEEYWTATTKGQRLRKVIDLSTRIPGGRGATFHQGRGGTFLQVHGDDVVLVGIDCDFCNNGSGIYTVPVKGGRVRKLVDVRNKLPNDPAQKFSRFSDDFHVNADRVVFGNAQSIFSVSLAGGGTGVVASNDNCGLGDYCRFDAPTLDTLDKQVLLRASDGFSNSKIARFNRTGGLIDIVADVDTHAPRTSAGYHFDQFRTFDLPVIDRTLDHNFSVFKGESIADSSPRISGIYSRGSAGFDRLVDSTMRVPGGTGKFDGTGFVDSGVRSLAAVNGIVIFRGVDAAFRHGIYAARADGSGKITKIIAQGDPINGTTVDAVEPASLVFRRDGFDGATLVFMAQYAGNTGRGIFSTKVVLP